MTEPALRSRRVLVTGVAGFIGFHLAQRLLAAGASVHGLDNFNSYYDVRLKRARLARIGEHERFCMSETDATDYAALKSLWGEFHPDCVVHLAAQAGVRYSIEQPRSYVSANLDAFLGVLEACRAHAVRHLVYASSSSVYGANDKVPFHEDDPVLAPVSLYGATKRANELMAQTYAQLYAIPCSGVRFFTVYGPWGRPDMAYYAFTKAIVEGRPIDVFNHGRMQRDFTYIDDVTEALIRLVDVPPPLGAGPSNAPHTIYNVGNHTPIELDRFIEAIEAALGRKADRRYLPMQPGDVPATWADVTRLSQAVGFAPNTTIEDGIDKFVAWYRTYHGRQ
jgi:UDP-glucuronate 4-epimerase